jgi:hypothetical protein
MIACNDCGLSFDPAAFGKSPPACPNCGQLARNHEGKWHNAARVVSLAEAGYLVNLLGASAVSARIYEDRAFNALSGRWDHAYLIQVPSDHLSQAAVMLRHESDAADQEDGDEFWSDGKPAQDEALIFWRPVALMAIAGVASFVVGQRFAQESGDGRERPYAQALVAAMEQAGMPLVTEPRGDAPRHRFIFQRHQRTWYVQSDRNGDGHYESTREFRGAAIMERRER